MFNGSFIYPPSIRTCLLPAPNFILGTKGGNYFRSTIISLPDRFVLVAPGTVLSFSSQTHPSIDLSMVIIIKYN